MIVRTAGKNMIVSQDL